MANPPLFQKLLRVLKVRGISGGLSITDTALDFAWNTDGAWHFATVRLPVGVVSGGTVLDALQFKDALVALRSQIWNGKKNDSSIQTVVSLGSAEAYLQSFNLPLLEGAKLEEAVELNLEMSSPIEADKSYSGWQVALRDEKFVRLEILSAFIERGVIDSFTPILKSTGFIIEAVEPGPLSIARAARTFASGFDPQVPTMLVLLGDTGVRIVLTRGGSFYFQYLVLWTEMQAGAKEISWEVFQGAFAENLRRVMGFAAGHGAVPQRVFLAGGNLDEPVTALLTNDFHLAVSPLVIHPGSGPDDITAPEWWRALGAGVRAERSLREDRELSLLGLSVRQEMVREQAVRFMNFWRIAFPVWLMVLIVITFGVAVVIGRTGNSVETQARIATTSDQGKEIQALQAKAATFNELVSALTTAFAPPLRVPTLEKVRLLLAEHDATFSRISIGENGDVSLEGKIPSEDKLLELANAFRANPEIGGVNIPLQEISVEPGNVHFSMTFAIISSKTP